MNNFILKHFSQRWSLWKATLFIIILNFLFYFFIKNFYTEAMFSFKILILIILAGFFNRILVSKGINPILCWILGLAFAFFPIPMIYFLWKVGKK
ncbi:hypothetical protein COU02_00190 [bacterium (Candidatus Gribaldobacteria) CG10_big_fil_rev_8_21_14_0_10_37_46]|uniref:Uncharacterized protein n=1 Tax=bacterium (Candidatus Gribaldobacteria) CG10_big_fil_rev_8_21_14_0_10_37_46 TaxID=2014276 RepID=A0A2H0UXA1_9BACT|nr:MAG: hypothetical protein COU02_00190 [bacterium (Candidatus Gribaldobacteria) CG10_big_fil_rev_8_21_14_0_10_37_46]